MEICIFGGDNETWREASSFGERWVLGQEGAYVKGPRPTQDNEVKDKSPSLLTIRHFFEGKG